MVQLVWEQQCQRSCVKLCTNMQLHEKKIGGALIRRLPAFKTVVAFVVLTLFKLPDPGANIYVQSLLNFPTWGVHERSKSPPYPVVPPLGHNIDSCITTERSRLLSCLLYGTNSNYLLLCFCKPVIGPWVLRENNALQFSQNV